MVQCLRETEELEHLKQIVDRESLAPIFEQEKELVWLMRYALPSFSLQFKF